MLRAASSNGCITLFDLCERQLCASSCCTGAPSKPRGILRCIAQVMAVGCISAIVWVPANHTLLELPRICFDLPSSDEHRTSNRETGAVGRSLRVPPVRRLESKPGPQGAGCSSCSAHRADLQATPHPGSADRLSSIVLRDWHLPRQSLCRLCPPNRHGRRRRLHGAPSACAPLRTARSQALQLVAGVIAGQAGQAAKVSPTTCTVRSAVGPWDCGPFRRRRHAAGWPPMAWSSCSFAPPVPAVAWERACFVVIF